MRPDIRHMLLAVLLVLLLPFSGLAQDSEDDVGFLARKLQEALSDAGREVKIRGFAGALSSRATIDELTIADDDGVWLTLRKAVFEWDPTAVLKKRIDIKEISAETLIVSRLPKPQAGGNMPSSTAAGFSLPELPVAVHIGKLAIDRADLATSILGERVVARLQGGLNLVAGQGDVNLSLTRIDKKVALIRLKGGYANASRILLLDLRLSEAEGGLVARLLDLPGSPSIDMGVRGSGPLDAFAAELFLATDGKDRLSGDLLLSSTVVSADNVQPVQRDWQFQADVGGDLAAVFKPDYQAFLGPDLRLSTQGALFADGRLVLDRFELKGAAVQLQGRLALGPNKWPEYINIEGRIQPPEGQRLTRLPLPGPATDLELLDLKLAYDAAVGNSWAAVIEGKGLEREGERLGALRLFGEGQITRQFGAETPGQVTAKLTLSAQNIGLGGDAVNTVLSQGVEGALNLIWDVGKPIEISTLNVTSGSISLTGSARISEFKSGGTVTGDVQMQVQDLSQVAPLAGRPLAGTLSVRLVGQGDVLGGGFDLTMTGSSKDFDVGVDQLAPYLSGKSNLELIVRRDPEGTNLEKFQLESSLVAVLASGFVSPTEGDINFNVQLKDISQFSSELKGRASVIGSLRKSAESWVVELEADSEAGFRSVASGQVAADFSMVDMSAKGSAPLALASNFIAPRSLSGLINFDLAFQGPPERNSFSGTLRTENARFSAPALRLALSDIDAAIFLTGRSAAVQVSSAVSPGGKLSGAGRVRLDAPYQAFLSLDIKDLILSDPALYDTVVNGSLSIVGPIAGGAKIIGSFDLGKTEVRIPSVISGNIANVPGLRHQNESLASQTTRIRAGFTGERLAGNGLPASYPIDLSLTATQGIFVRGRGLDIELGGAMRLLGTTDNLIPEGEFELVRGRLDFLARRLDISEAQISLEGEFLPTVYIVAGSQVEDTLVQIIVDGPMDGPEITFTSEPELPEDEALALLLFGTSISNLSVFQAAELVAAVAELAGRSSFNLVAKLRQSFGLDDLNIETNDEGNITLRAGKYLSENIYTDVAVDSDGQTEISLNLDITDAFTAKGSVASDGSSSLGVFFEKDF